VSSDIRPVDYLRDDGETTVVNIAFTANKR